MPVTKAISGLANVKQLTGADSPQNPGSLVTYTYGPAVSTAGQTIINLGFSVSTSNTSNFFFWVDGKLMSLGSTNDYTFTNTQSNGTSSQVTMTQPLAANLNLNAVYLGVLIPTAASTSILTINSEISALQASIPKNYLINGAFDFWQRGTSVTIANTASTYEADRWYGKNSLGTNGVLTFSQTTGVNNGSKFGASLQITTAPTAAQTNGTELYQVIENFNSLELYNQVASFSVYVKALGNVTSVGLQFFYATTEVKVTTALGSEQTVTVNSSTFTLGNLLNQSIGTLPTTAGVVGVRIRILGVSTGNTYDLNNGFVVEQAMVNLGATAANFARCGRSIAEEMSLCERYYIKTYDLTTAPGTTTQIGAIVTNTAVAAASLECTANMSLSVPMRTSSPAVTLYSTTGASGNWRDINGGGDVAVATWTVGNRNISVYNTGAVGNSSRYLTGHITADGDI